MKKNLPHHEGIAELSDRDAQVNPVVKWPFKRILNNHLIVQIDTFQYTGRVLVPDSAKRRPTTGHVVAVASNIIDIKVGERVLFSQFAGFLLKFSGTPYCRSISYEEVVMILTDDAPELEHEGA
jgi:co-chaperonin GroES (HSP10)